MRDRRPMDLLQRGELDEVLGVLAGITLVPSYEIPRLQVLSSSDPYLSDSAPKSISSTDSKRLDKYSFTIYQAYY